VRALVTGAFGFLGSAISTGLERDGWTVVRTGRPRTEIPSPAFESLLERSEPSLVVHCAGPASVPASVADPEADRRGSVDVLSSVLDRLAALSVPPRVLLISSAAVYGQPERLPVRETDPLTPISPYGRNRVACESLVREYASVAPAAALRVFSAYGEGLARQLLWDVSQKALARKPLVLAGTGKESRDFIHADDVAQAVACVARREPRDTEIYNVATGRQLTVAELAALLLAALGIEGEVSFSGRARPGDPERWQADVSRIGSLGFEPAVAIGEGVRRYAAWVSAYASASTAPR